MSKVLTTKIKKKEEVLISVPIGSSIDDLFQALTQIRSGLSLTAVHQTTEKEFVLVYEG